MNLVEVWLTLSLLPYFGEHLTPVTLFSCCLLKVWSVTMIILPIRFQFINWSVRL